MIGQWRARPHLSSAASAHRSRTLPQSCATIGFAGMAQLSAQGRQPQPAREYARRRGGTIMAQSRLHAVYELGQSIWYDNIRRSVITSGELRRLMDQDAVVGVTSNPTIFEKAIDGGTDYDTAIKSLVSRGVTEGKAVFEALAIDDIQAAADILR